MSAFSYRYITFGVLYLIGMQVLGQQYQFSQLNISGGLSNNQVNSIYKDSKGFMWFGTMSGLNRFDGYSFKVFKHVLRDTTTLNDDNILSIEDGPGDKLWIQTRLGYNIYDPAREAFNRDPRTYLSALGIQGAVTDIHASGNSTYWFATSYGLYRYRKADKKARLVYRESEKSAITSIWGTQNGYVWIVNSRGVLRQINAEGKKILYNRKIASSAQTAMYKLFLDKEGDVWVFATDSPQGLFYLSANKQTYEHYTKENPKLKLNTNIIYSISQDTRGDIWIGTDHGGINVFNKTTYATRYLTNREGDTKSLAQNSITTLYKDDAGIMWAGTFKKGISYYHESIIKFPLYKHHPSEANSLAYEDVNRFVEDAKGNLWIGTNGGGLIYFDRINNTFKRYRHDPLNPTSLSNDVIVSLWLDSQQKLWIGTYFGGLDCFDGKAFRHYRHNEAVESSLSDDRVWEIMEDSGQNLWIGTLGGGLNVLDKNRKTFRHYKPGLPNSIRSHYIAALIEDKQNNIWIGTDNGIDVFEKHSNRFKHYSHAAEDSESLSNNNVITLLEDSRGWIWAGTQDGLNIFNPKKGRFLTLRTTHGLPDNTILNILEDDSHQIWISTPNGISNVRVSYKAGTYNFSCRNYDELDGLQGRGFNENAALKTRSGELIFGGANGFNLFKPEAIKSNKVAPTVLLTDFELFNKTVQPGEKVDGNMVLSHSITYTSGLMLRHDQDVFSIGFAALNFSNAAKNKYSYILEGFSDKWLTTDASVRKATFTNLDPGEYVFRVKASNDAGVWNDEGVALKIRILPPFWETPTAYVLYFLVIAGILIYIRQRGIRKLKMQFALEQERQAAQRMHELDMLKIKFFTNVSHEFRTPLSLILTPLDKLLKQSEDVAEKKHLELIQRNARRLLNLVNQLMDFRKMEVQQLKLQPEEGDIVQFIKENFHSFTDLAEKKNISFSFTSELSSFVTSFDHDKVERILFNLLSNAFKFTPQGGTIGIELSFKGFYKEDTACLQIKISDTGIGISADKQEKIFERFFQNDVPGSMVNQGSGIGLAITREFVNLHEGGISLESSPGKGSCFTVELPVEAIRMVQDTIVFMEEQHIHEEASSRETPSMDNHSQGSKKPVILLIEDNEDFLFYLKDNLRQDYTILEASNGKMGWHKTLSSHPDLIVSDISMPEMNGIDLCLKIRSDRRTQHIPVILLTALTGEESLLRGLETGANDYMTKPFNFEVLMSKIRNLLSQHESMRKTYQKQIEAQPATIEVVSGDEKFIQQALLVIEENMSNSDFSVEEFSRKMCMSRVALYKKLLSITRQTPIEFIRNIRLKRAAQLLEKSQFTVSEIAYEVGFNNPKYFAKYFKAEFGVLPSLWQKTKRSTANPPVFNN